MFFFGKFDRNDQFGFLRQLIEHFRLRATKDKRADQLFEQMLFFFVLLLFDRKNEAVAELLIGT